MTAQDILEAFRRVEYRHYMRSYMADRRAKRPARICPRCGAREVEWHCRICSECRAVSDEHYREVSRHIWRAKHKGAKA